MSIKMKLGATAMASTALVASACSIAEFDALMIVLRDLNYNDAEINNLLQGDSVDIARYFVEREFERTQWKAVTSSAGYKEELMKTYVPMVQKFDAAAPEAETLASGVVIQKTSVNELINLTNGLAEVGYDEKSLEKVTDKPISLDSVNRINDSGLVPDLITGIIGADNVKEDSIGGGQTLLDKYVEFADIVSDGRSDAFVAEGDFDLSTISTSVNLLDSMDMTDFEGDDAFDPSAAMAISEFLDGEYSRVRAEVLANLGYTEASYEKLSDSQKATIDRQVQESLDGEMTDMQADLEATTERLRRKTPTFTFTVRTLAEINAVFPNLTNDDVLIAVGAMPGDEISESDISISVDLGVLATGGTNDVEIVMKAFFDVTATFLEDGSTTEVDITTKITPDYNVASDFDENNVGSYTIGYEVAENYNGNLEDLANMGTHLGASKFAYVEINDVDPVFSDPAQGGTAPDTSTDFENIDQDDFELESGILDPQGNYDPNNSIHTALAGIEIYYGTTKIKFGAFENDPNAIEADDVGAKVEIKYYEFDAVANGWSHRTEYTRISDLEHLISTPGAYQIQVVFTNQSGDEHLIGGKGITFDIQSKDIAPPTIMFKDSHFTYNFNGTGTNVGVIAQSLKYSYVGEADEASADIVFFDNISSINELKTKTYLLFDKTYIDKFGAGVDSVCSDLTEYKWNGNKTGMNFNITGFNTDDKMCDISLMGTEFMEERLLMDAQDDFKLLVTAGDENDNWSYNTNEIKLTNTSGINVDFNGGKGTENDPFILDTYQSLYTDDMSKLRESLFDLASVSSNDLKWVQDLKNANPQSFNLVAGQSLAYNNADATEYTYLVADSHGNEAKGSIFVKFVDTTAPVITSEPKVLSNTVAPTIRQGTDAMALFNTRVTDNDKSFISSSSGMFITHEHVESIQMRFVNSMGNVVYDTLVNDGSDDWSVIPVDPWSTSEEAQSITRSNPEGREMNITGHFGLLEFTYNVKVTDPSGNELRQPYIIPQVKVYDQSEPVLVSYGGTANIANLQNNAITLDDWRLPYATHSNGIENRLVLTDHTSRLTGYKTDAITGFHIDVGQSSGRFVSFFWISQDLRRVNNTPQWNTNPVNSNPNEPFWNSFSSGDAHKGTIGSLDYDLLKEDWQGFVSGNGSYLYQNYNGTGLSLIMVPTMYTNITGASENNDYIQTDVSYNYDQQHWEDYMGAPTGHYYLSIIQMLGRNTGGVQPYWNEFGTWS